MNQYDVVIVLGSQPDTITWEFPQQVYNCLERAKVLIDEKQAPYIATSGKWSIALDAIGLKQPFRECDELADYLIKQGVPESKIIREGDSKDTISNLFYLKTQILIPRGMKRLLFVVAEFRIPRLKFLCERILGNEYTIVFEPIASEVGSSYNERVTMKEQKEFLEPMISGDHAWLADKFFTAPKYLYWAELDREKYKSIRNRKVSS